MLTICKYLRSVDSSSAATKYLKNTQRPLSLLPLMCDDESFPPNKSSVVYTAAVVRYVTVLAVDTDPTITEITGRLSVVSASDTVTGNENSTPISTSSLYPKGPESICGERGGEAREGKVVPERNVNEVHLIT